MRFSRRRASDHAVVRQVASVCLGYPDDDTLAMAPLLDAALCEQPADEPIAGLRTFVGHLRDSDPKVLRQDYIDLFDLSRKHTLYLSYWTAGDTRRRGEELGVFKKQYRDSGFVVDLRGELPDHLPIVLEFAARVDSDAGTHLLQEHRPALELLRLSLVERRTPYADVVTAVCATLPGESPADRRAVMAMQGAPPPVESVGLEPYDPRLLPISPTAPRAGVFDEVG
ncbi:nitrate reductase molybdenum cofactor assembly chaperone [Gordonia sp. SID5947]|uniref:nitrate reductase molybdenum cofactor assembly chaperone n=1 Tax=Gordonia sp. SID5947 TaxID=2690315 RepID=UPI00136A07FA|nr:nitrate reductase molybdenum cofactor assembly chaperone [Gordonia sp. SID5947]MYR08794.1 nitrate reductase molybdenum cofactor assembly chaperone [Gordonia sp. SID5947]